MATNLGSTFRIIHRYLGFFLAGIMAVYAISGIVMIFRDTDFLKEEKQIEKKIAINASVDSLGKWIGIKELKEVSEQGDLILFKEGKYSKSTGVATYTVKELPVVLYKMTKLHKAKSKEPLFFLNIFFGVALLFFVISSFWMFMPKTTIFRKGIYFTIAGIILTLILLFR